MSKKKAKTFRINQKLLPYFKGFSFSADVICIHEMSILFELSRFGRNDEYKGSKMLRYKGGLSPLIDETVRKRKKQVGSIVFSKINDSALTYKLAAFRG